MPEFTGTRSFLYLLCLLGILFLVPLAAGAEAGRGTDGMKPAEAAGPEDWFRLGIARYREGRFDEAVGCLERALEGAPPWREYAYFYLLESHWRADRVAEAIGLCKAFEHHFPASPLLPRVRRIEARGYRKSSAYWLAARAYEALLEERERPDDRIEYGEVLERLDRFEEAYEDYQRVRARWPRSEEARVAKRRIRRLVEAHPELVEKTPLKSRLQREMELTLRERAYGETLSACRRLLELPLSRAERKRVLRDQLIALVGRGRLSTAHGVLRRMRREFPGSSEVAEGLLVVGRAYWRKNLNRKAFPLLTFLLEQYTDMGEAMRAAFILGRIHFEQGDLRAAIRQFREARYLYPDTRWEEEAAWGEAWSHYLLGEYQGCVSQLQECISQEVWDVSVPRALYWKARCLEKAGRKAAARRLYESISSKQLQSFYSLLARWRLTGGSLDSVIREWSETLPPPPPAPAEEDPVRALQDPAMPVLLDAGLRRDAAERLDWLEARSGSEEPDGVSWAEAHCEVGDYAGAMRIIRARGLLASTLADGISGRDPAALRRLRLLYPLPRGFGLLERAEEHGLDPFFVAGLIHQESLFMDDVVSPAGAVGLMQLMPATAKRVARRIGLEDFRVETLADPETNIRIGTAYLEELAGRYGRDWPKVLAAYNAGPAPVARWSRVRPKAEIDEFIEGILYRETRIYVKKVLYNWFLYRRLYGGGRGFDRR